MLNIDAPYVYATGFGDINNARHISGYGADPNEYRNAGIETISSLVPISRAGGLKLFKPIAAKTGGLVKIGTIEGDVVIFSSKIGKETVEGITNFVVKDGKLYLNQLH